MYAFSIISKSLRSIYVTQASEIRTSSRLRASFLKAPLPLVQLGLNKVTVYYNKKNIVLHTGYGTPQPQTPFHSQTKGTVSQIYSFLIEAALASPPEAGLTPSHQTKLKPFSNPAFGENNY